MSNDWAGAKDYWANHKCTLACSHTRPENRPIPDQADSIDEIFRKHSGYIRKWVAGKGTVYPEDEIKADLLVYCNKQVVLGRIDEVECMGIFAVDMPELLTLLDKRLTHLKQQLKDSV